MERGESRVERAPERFSGEIGLGSKFGKKALFLPLALPLCLPVPSPHSLPLVPLAASLWLPGEQPGSLPKVYFGVICNGV